jgi:hypothetical protein
MMEADLPKRLYRTLRRHIPDDGSLQESSALCFLVSVFVFTVYVVDIRRDNNMRCGRPTGIRIVRSNVVEVFTSWRLANCEVHSMSVSTG